MKNNFEFPPTPPIPDDQSPELPPPIPDDQSPELPPPIPDQTFDFPPQPPDNKNETSENQSEYYHLIANFDTDLKAVEESNGEIFKEAERAGLNFFKDYEMLLSARDNPIIKEYIDSIKNSAAFNAIAEQYERSKNENDIQLELEELKNTVEKAREFFEDDFTKFERHMRSVDELLQNPPRYIEDLLDELTRTMRSIEDSLDSLKSFRSKNEEYRQAIDRYKPSSDHGEIDYIDSNARQIKATRRKLAEADEYIYNLRKQILNRLNS